MANGEWNWLNSKWNGIKAGVDFRYFNLRQFNSISLIKLAKIGTNENAFAFRLFVYFFSFISFHIGFSFICCCYSHTNFHKHWRTHSVLNNLIMRIENLHPQPWKLNKTANSNTQNQFNKNQIRKFHIIFGLHKMII